ncbi:unnamed protein product [Nezara viridula]|uniref:Neuropeptide n=1 Tax=Nezara viridula TaxID=85310 RepID=A0A9P0HPB3_NEZVI|nr:unnamed protein product [Nezara viridula]
MSKLVFFLFFAVCVAVVQMAPAAENEDDLFDLSPDLDVEGRFNIPWEKGWAVVKPILKEAGKAAGKEIIKGVSEGIKKN